MREKHNKHRTHRQPVWKGQLGDRRAIMSKLMAGTTVCYMSLLLLIRNLLTMYRLTFFYYLLNGEHTALTGHLDLNVVVVAAPRSKRLPTVR